MLGLAIAAVGGVIFATPLAALWACSRSVDHEHDTNHPAPGDDE